MLELHGSKCGESRVIQQLLVRQWYVSHTTIVGAYVSKLSSIDLNRIMSRCSFAMASYAPSATSLLAGVQVQATKPATTMTAGADAQSGAAKRIEVGAHTIVGRVLLASLCLGAAVIVDML
jgi:hypothetical protein